MIGIHGLIRHLNELYRDILDEKGRKYCDRILASSEQLLDLVEKINAYIATKEVPLHLESVSVAKLFETLNEEFSARMQSRGVRMVLPDRFPVIRTDRLAMLRVFRNLMDNALKYGGDGLREITIGHVEQDEFHIFSVQDDGVGLEVADADQVFGLFKREKTSRGVQGAGLGLADRKGNR